MLLRVPEVVCSTTPMILSSILRKQPLHPGQRFEMITPVLNNQQFFPLAQQGDQLPSECLLQQEQGSLQKLRAAAAQFYPVFHQVIDAVPPHTVIVWPRISFWDILIAVGRGQKRHMAKQALQHIIEVKSIVHAVVDM